MEHLLGVLPYSQLGVQENRTPHHGEVANAQKIMDKALQNVRAKLNLQPVSADYTLVSMESLIMILLFFVQNSSSSSSNMNDDFKANHKLMSERWDILKQYRCDPWYELKYWRHSLKQPFTEFSTETKINEFDIGLQTVSKHYRSEDTEALEAYSFLRFCEEIGTPFNLPWTGIAATAAQGAAQRIVKYSLFWALVVVVRTGEVKGVEKLLNRESLSLLPGGATDLFISHYLRIMRDCAQGTSLDEKQAPHSMMAKLSSVVPELLSRLVTTCSAEKRLDILDYLLVVYRSEHNVEYKGIANLLKRTLASLSVTQRFNAIPKLLGFPYPQKLFFRETYEFLCPFGFLDIEAADVESLEPPSISHEALDTWIQSVQSQTAEERCWATSVLKTLHMLKLLPEAYEKQFAEALWAQKNDHGLPDVTSYYTFAFLVLPKPTGIDVEHLFKQYVESTSFPKQEGKTVRLVQRTNDLCHNLIHGSRHITWTQQEAASQLTRVIDWWDADKHWLKDQEDSPFSSTPDEFRLLIGVLVQAVVPSLSTSDTAEDITLELRRIIDELPKYGLSAIRLECACLHLFPETKESIVQTLQSYLTSYSRELTRDALQSVYDIATIHSDTDFPVDFIPILETMANVIGFRKRTGLTDTLNAIADMLRYAPSIPWQRIEQPLLIGLENLAAETTDKDSEIDFDDRLTIRFYAAKLAYRLSLAYTKADQPYPETLKKWEEVCRSDQEFAEVRNQWIFKDDSS